MSPRPTATLLLAGLALAACGPAAPFYSTSGSRGHCRAALNYLVSKESEKTRISVEDTSERGRGDATAVTIIYVQGESRRLFTCLYQPDQPNRIVGGSYRGQPFTPAQLDEVNFAAGARR